MKSFLSVLLLIIALFLAVPEAGGQTSSAARRIITGATLPATCNPGDVFFLTSNEVNAIGSYTCTATNTWNLTASIGGGSVASNVLIKSGGSGALAASSVTDSGTLVGTSSIIQSPTFSVSSTAGDVGTPSNGYIWYNSSTGKFRAQQGGSTVDLISSGGSVAGSNKQVQFNNSSAFGGATGFEYQSGASPNVLITAQNAAYEALRLKMAATPSEKPFKIVTSADAEIFSIDQNGTHRAIAGSPGAGGPFSIVEAGNGTWSTGRTGSGNLVTFANVASGTMSNLFVQGSGASDPYANNESGLVSANGFNLHFIGTGASIYATTSTSTTAAVDPTLTLDGYTSGTPAAGYGAGLVFTLKSSTTSKQNAATIAAVWTTATHASRTADIVFQNVYNAGSLAETARVTAGGYVKWQGEGYLASDATSTSATLAALSLDRDIPVKSGKKYSFMVALYVNDSVAAEGAKFDFNGGSATMTNFRVHCLGFDTALTINTQTTALNTAISAATFTGASLLECHGTMEPSADGTFIMKFAQNSHTSGTLTIAKGSHILVWEH